MGEEVRKEQFMDKFSRVDELILDNIQTTNLLREDIKMSLNRNADILEKILNKEGLALIPLTFVYPTEGAVVSIAEGTTTLDYEQGMITSPADVNTDMNFSLISQSKDYVRSLSIWVDKPVIISLDSKVKYPVKYGRWFSLSYQQFRTLKITTTGTTKVFVIASTNVETPLTEMSALDEYLTEKVNTATALTVNDKYAGGSFETQGYSKLVGFAVADKAGRLEIQQSQSDFIEDVISEFDLDMAIVALDGCIVFNDNTNGYASELTDVNDAGANDVITPPITVNEADIIYFGGYVRFNKIYITVGTAGAYTGAITWEYWNGSAWTDLSTAHNLSDGTGSFKNAAGSYNVTFDMPTDWAECAVDSATLNTTMFWIRAKAACTVLTTSPLITQAWIYPLVEIPFSIDILCKYAKLVYYNKTTAQTYFRAVCNLKNLK